MDLGEQTTRKIAMAVSTDEGTDCHGNRGGNQCPKDGVVVVEAEDVCKGFAICTVEAR